MARVDYADHNYRLKRGTFMEDDQFIKVYAIKFWGDEDYMVVRSLEDICKIIAANEDANKGEPLDFLLRVLYIDPKEYDSLEEYK